MSIIETNIWYMCILTSMCWIYCYGWLKVDKVHPRGALQMAREDSFFCIPRVLHSKECTLTLNVPYIGSKWYILERWMRSCNHNYVRSILYGNRWHIHIYKGLHVVPMGAHLVYMGAQCRPNGRPWAQNVGLWYLGTCEKKKEKE